MEVDHLGESRRYEVTHERIQVVTAMTSKSFRCFNNIRNREIRRDKYDEVWCLHSHSFGTKRCLEKLKESGTEVPKETVDPRVGSLPFSPCTGVEVPYRGYSR